MEKSFIKNGLILCGLVNIFGVLLVTRLFTNFDSTYYQPSEMSKFTLVMILLWGFVYIVTAPTITQMPKLLLVFIVEKLAFVYVWANWMKHHYMLAQQMLEKDFLTGGFQLIYGINDLFWALFFIWVYFYLTQNKVKTT